MADPQVQDINLLTKILGGNQALNFAKYGGYGLEPDVNTRPSKLKGFLSGLGSLADIAAPALAAAFPNGPLPQFLNAANQAMNVSQYNKYMQQQQKNANLQMQKRNINDAGLYTDATGLSVASPESGFDISLATAMAPMVRKNNANPAILELLNTGKFNPEDNKADYGDIPMKLMERANAINDANSTIDQLRGFASESPLFKGKPLFNPAEAPLVAQSMLDPGTSDSPNLLKTGVSELVNKPGSFVTPANAGTFGIPNIEQLLTGRKNEYGLFNDMRSTDENIRSNKSKEGEAARHNKAGEGIDWYKAKTDRMYPPGRGGSSQNPYDIPLSQQKLIKGQAAAIEAQMKSEGFMDKDGNVKAPGTGQGKYELPGGLFGAEWGNWSDPKTQAKHARFQQLNAQREQLLGAMTGLAFGGAGKAQQNIKQAAQKATYKGAKGNYSY
jgi:hypothetical protein